MTDTLTAAQREKARRERIKTAQARLAALPGNLREQAIDRAAELEQAARAADPKDRTASVAFTEQALDILEAAQRLAADLAGAKPVASAVIDLDDPASVAKGVNDLAHGALESLRERVIGLAGDGTVGGVDAAGIATALNLNPALVTDLLEPWLKARDLRASGMTVVEVAQHVGFPSAQVREWVEDVEPKAAKKAAAKAAKPARRREPRPSREVDGRREEKCPHCDQWRDAQADFRPVRPQCRLCYNAEWKAGNERRKAARAAAVVGSAAHSASA